MQCYGHTLNLLLVILLKQSSVMKDCLDTCYEVVKLIKFSPKREAMLHDQKEECSSEAPGVRILSLMRWTVHAKFVTRIIANYDYIQLIWEIVVCATSNTEIKARICGVWSQMQSLSFCLVLSGQK